MKKHAMLLLAAAFFPLLAFGQSQPVTASWTPEHRVTLAEMPASGQAIQLPVPAHWQEKTEALQAVCERMSTEFSSWKTSDDGQYLVVVLHPSSRPAWTKDNWQVHLSRVTSAYLTN